MSSTTQDPDLPLRREQRGWDERFQVDTDGLCDGLSITW